MGNNSTNINNTNSHHLFKSINTKTRHVKLEIQVLTWNRHKNVAGINRLMWSNLSLLIIRSSMAI